jgi:hypothetical protein
MSRRTQTITIAEEPDNRDSGKVFILTEMPATAGERWAMQLMYLLTQTGVPLDSGVLNAGMSGLATAISSAGVALLRALQDPSLDAWRDCVRYQHQPNHPLQPINWDSAACQIEEIKTVGALRMAVVELHTGFFSPEPPSSSASSSPGAKPTGSSPTRMSHHRSAQ